MDTRGLPRFFVDGADPSEPIPLPASEINKITKVLRMTNGAEIAVLPNDGSIIRARYQDGTAVPIETFHPNTEAPIHVTVIQALPKADKLEEIVRACSEIGVSRFVLFGSDRSIVQWEAKKLGDKLQRLETIAREACEVAFRTRLPVFEHLPSLKEALAKYPDAVVLSEVEGVPKPLPKAKDNAALVIGPEGGWSPRELAMIGDRAVTLGPRVLRVDHAAAAAAAIWLLSHEA